MSKVYSCACCGSDVTVPYFFNGAAYGYTCIKKADPTAKRTKDNGLWIAYQELIIDQPNPNQARYIVYVMANGKKFEIGASYDNQEFTMLKSKIAVNSKLFRIAQFANGASPYYKSPIIKTENNKVLSVEINGLPA